MGVYCNYTGTVDIPDELKEELNKNMLTLLQRGGMMQFEKVNIYNKGIALIRPVEYETYISNDNPKIKEDRIVFHYNYFEDDTWETAVYYAKNQWLGTAKIGSNEFAYVMLAALTLIELYDSSYGLAELDGEVFNTTPFIGWINQILGKDFSYEKRFDVWKCYEYFFMHLIDNDIYDPEDKDNYRLLDITTEYLDGIRSFEFLDLLFIFKGSPKKLSEYDKNTYSEDVFSVKSELQHLFDIYGETEKENLYKLLSLSYEDRKAFSNEKYKKLAAMTLEIPSRVFVYLAMEIFNQDFWREWHDVKDNCYEDEIVKEYGSKRTVTDILEARKVPVEKIKTEIFLWDDDKYTKDPPEELKYKQDYHLSGDDMLYWWNNDSDAVELSDDMIVTLNNWSNQLEMIKKEISTEDVERYNMLSELMSLLGRANAEYKRIYAFKDMFYDFLDHGYNLNYIAAVKLFGKLLDDNWDAGKIIEKVGCWEFASKKVKFNEGRVAIKRYLSVMANKELRWKYFNF